jgi:DNA-binding CsgD family transcriptional regulator
MSITARRLRPSDGIPAWCREAITLERIERLGVHGCFWLHFLDATGTIVHAAGAMPGTDRSIEGCAGAPLDRVIPADLWPERRAVLEEILSEPPRPLLAIDMSGGREVWTLCETECDHEGHCGVLAIGYRPCVEQIVPGDIQVRRFRRVLDPGVLRELSLGEIEVLRLLALGRTREEMAHLVHRTVKAVERRRTTLGRKLGLGSSHMIALAGLRAGLHRFTSEDLESFWTANCDHHRNHARD